MPFKWFLCYSSSCDRRPACITFPPRSPRQSVVTRRIVNRPLIPIMKQSKGPPCMQTAAKIHAGRQRRSTIISCLSLTSSVGKPTVHVNCMHKENQLCGVSALLLMYHRTARSGSSLPIVVLSSYLPVFVPPLILPRFVLLHVGCSSAS